MYSVITVPPALLVCLSPCSWTVVMVVIQHCLLFVRAGCPGASQGSSPTLLISHSWAGVAGVSALHCLGSETGPGDSDFAVAFRCPSHQGDKGTLQG